MLSEEQIEKYHSDGYLAIEGVLSNDELSELRRVTDEFLEKSRALTQSDTIYDLGPDHTAKTPRLRRISYPTKQHPIYDAMIHHKGILDRVEQLIGPGIGQNGDKLNFKLPEEGSPVQWHQDWAFYPHTNDDLLAVGIAIDDMTLENGCLMVIPGSHKGRVYDHLQNGYFIGAVTEPDFTAEGAVPIQIKAGGISIHHVRLLHGSAANTSNTSRRLLLFQYCALDAWPLLHANTASDDLWENLKNKTLRGERTNQPRVTAVPVRLPLPRKQGVGSIYQRQTELERPLFDATLKG